MKIAILNVYQGSVERGAERVIIELGEKLKEKNTVSVFGGDKLPPKRWPYLWKLFIDPQGLYIFWWTFKLLSRIIKERFDVVIPTNSGWQPALIRFITWLYGGKMVIIGHSGIGWDEINNLWSFPDVFIAPSSYSAEWARKVNPFISVEYIPNGVNLSDFSAKGSKINLKLKHPIVLCVGALAPEKRLDLAVRAVAKLKDTSLLIIGRGQLKEVIKNLCELKLKNRFKMVESSFDDTSTYYRSVDIFTAPSSPRQSFELVVLEAMSTNLAVVANDDPIRREIIGNAGMFVDPTDSDKYAKALKSALKRNWGNSPRTQAEKFSWEIVTEKYESVFNKLLRKE